MDSSKPAKQKKPKIGEGHLKAMLRQGLREVQSAMYTGSNIAREPEPGMFGNPTQGEIAADRRPGEQPSILDAHSADARARAQRTRNAPERSSPEPSRE